VYHLYFGDQAGNPGTIITFFPHPETRKGRIGGGQVGITAFVIPPGTIGFWEDRLKSYGFSVMKATRFSEQYLQFSDKDGLRLEFVEREKGQNSEWLFGDISADKAIKGIGGAVLFSMNAQKTMDALENVMGLKKVGEDVGYARFQTSGDPSNLIDVSVSDMEWGVVGAGTVHHIAWRAKDFEEHAEWHREVAQSGYQPTQIIDRKYFNAIYFREEGGILFEIATDPPGFAHDEDPDALGEKLMLPSWLEPSRAQVEANLLPIQVSKV